MTKHLSKLVVVFILAIASGCATSSSSLDANLGGATTRIDNTNNAFGLTAANLSPEDRRKFEIGDSFFTQSWVVAPASADLRDGLGPTFNARACASCHVLDGRGAPPTGPDDQSTRGLLIRLSLPGNKPDLRYGDQLQDKANDGIPVEGELVVSYKESTTTLRDGTKVQLREPVFDFRKLAHGPFEPGTMMSARLAPQVIGMGLLEAIPEEAIRNAADPDDKNRDGISGRPNILANGVLGRLGWKANAGSVAEQVQNAFAGDIGITNPLHPDENCPVIQKECAKATNGGTPEITDSRLAAVIFYQRVLAVPAMRDADKSEVKEGSKQFTAMGCASCHTPTQKTATSDIPALENQTIHPYTDLLLHDMGPGLADGRPDFQADGTEWRTPPLWGIGLLDEVNGNKFFLHDGRARTIEEAILWHGGEAQTARDNYSNADARKRQALIRFLESL